MLFAGCFSKNVKNTEQFKTVFNSDMAYITQLKQKKKSAITFAAVAIMSVCSYVIAPFWFLLLIVWCRPCRR